MDPSSHHPVAQVMAPHFEFAEQVAEQPLIGGQLDRLGSPRLEMIARQQLADDGVVPRLRGINGGIACLL